MFLPTVTHRSREDARNDRVRQKAAQRENLELSRKTLAARVFARLAFINDVSSRPFWACWQAGTASAVRPVRHDG